MTDHIEKLARQYDWTKGGARNWHLERPEDIKAQAFEDGYRRALDDDADEKVKHLIREVWARDQMAQELRYMLDRIKRCDVPGAAYHAANGEWGHIVAGLQQLAGDALLATKKET
jgi:hypothetical protein